MSLKINTTLIPSISKIRLKRKRFSKKLKKNQRKIDISDVEQYLNQKIEDTLRGGPVELKENDQLFFVDTVVKPERISRKEYFKNKKSTLEKFLEPNPNTPIVAIPQKIRDNKLGFELSQKVEKIIKAKSNSPPKVESPSKTKVSVFDAWAPQPDEILGLNEWNSHVIPNKPTPPKRIIPSELPAVEINSSISYRPDESLQKKFVEEVAKTEEKQEKLAAKLSKHVPKAVVDPTSELMQFIVSQQSVENEQEKEIEENRASSEDEDKETTDRKSTFEKKKELKRKARHREEQLKLAEKKMKMDLDNVLETAAEIDKEAQEQEKRREERKQRERERNNSMKTKKFGRFNYVEPSKINEVILPDEVPKALRTAPRSTVDIALERFKSFQKRNIIPVSAKAEDRLSVNYREPKKSKKKLKSFERHNNEVWIPNLS